MNVERKLHAYPAAMATRAAHLLPDIKSGVSVKDTWSFTRPRVSRTSFVWTIRDFSSYTQEMESPEFFVINTVNSNETAWLLKLYPSYSNHFALDLRFLYSNGNEKISAKCNLSVLNAELEKTMYRHTLFYRSRLHGRDDRISHVRCEEFLKRAVLLDERNGLLVNDTLTIKCELAVSEQQTPVCISSQLNEEVPSVHELNLANQLKTLFDRKEMTDVTLIAGEREFAAHKAILAARSPVFAAMFEHEMVERMQNKVTITDVDPKVLEETLVFIYTDKSPNLENMAADLLVVADKYDLGRLKKVCEEVIGAKINGDNMAEIFSLADSHKAETLKDKVISFVASQTKNLMKTNAWRDMLSKNSNLVAEAFQQASKSRSVEEKPVYPEK